MRTAFMTTVTLDETKARDILKARTDRKLCRKKAVGALVINQTGRDLHFPVKMQDGKLEAERATLKPGFGAIVQKGLEMNVQISPKGLPTHAKLYDITNPMTPEKAFEVAHLRGLTIPTPQQVVATLNLFEEEDIDPRQLPWTYVVSLGELYPFRYGLRFELPKPSWQSVQVAEMDSTLVLNYKSDEDGEVYGIGMPELMENWVLDEDPSLNTTDFRKALPTISDDEFNAMIGE